MADAFTSSARSQAFSRSDRRSFIGGSDARIIMGSDEAALLRLWQEKRGEVEPEDLSGNLIVQLGVVTEDLNRRWFEANTGLAVRDVQRRAHHPVLKWMAATLDGVVESSGAVFESKFMLPWSFSDVQSSRRSWPVYQTRSWSHGRPASCRQKTPSPQKIRTSSKGRSRRGWSRSTKLRRDLQSTAPSIKRSSTTADPPLPLPKTSRRRDKRHLRFVASQPCLVCRRAPSDPHHLRFAEPRALGCKVSDEFTVPLCRFHHRALHDSGDERAFWHNSGIDPLPIARGLWNEHQRPSPF